MSTSTLPRPSLPPSPSDPPTAPLPSIPKKTRKSLPAPSTRSSLTPTSLPATPSRLRTPSAALGSTSIPTSHPKQLGRNSPAPSLPQPKVRSPALQSSSPERTLKKSVSIASFPAPPKPLSKIGRPSLGVQTATASLAPNFPPTPEDTPTAPLSAPLPKAKPLRSQQASTSLHSSYQKSPSLLNGAESVPVARTTSTTRRSGSDGLNSQGSPTRSRSSSAEGSYSTTATTFEDLDEIKPADEALDSDGSGSGAKRDKQGNVVISVRVRPNAEAENGTDNEWMVDGRSSLISYRGKEGGEYAYDNVFASRDDNGRVYDACARRLVRRVMEGFHGTVFAYGMTGTGKTFSMQGTHQSPGVIPRAVQDIFSYIRETPQREFLLRVSYLEIYNEEIRDLLVPVGSDAFGAAKPEKIRLREDSKGNVYATPLKEEIVQSTNQLLQVIAKGDKSRRVGATQYNSHSSRSHAIVQIVVESRERTVGEADKSANRRTAITPGGVRVSSLSLIDLAGSERAAEDKTRRTEGAHINKSLLTLGTVISKLSGGKDGKDRDGRHLPYRDSKLTRLLQPALSGNSLISILCTIQVGAKGATAAATHTQNYETLNTLKFAARARNNIVSHAKRVEEAGPNDGASSALLERYRIEIQSLRSQLETQAVMQAEKEEARMEQEVHHRHEEQLLEMQLARTALRERIEHLNQLIISSRSIGVNDTRASVMSMGGRSVISIGEGQRSVRSSTSNQTLQSLNRAASVKSTTTATLNSHLAALRSPHSSSFDGTNSISPADFDSSSVATFVPDELVALENQNRALHSDIADKNRYISTLEKRLLQARRTSHGRMSAVASPGLSISTMQEKDQEIAALKAKLEERDRTVAELRAQNRTLTNSLMLMSPDQPNSGGSTSTSPTTPQPFSTPLITSSLDATVKHSNKPSTGSATTIGSSTDLSPVDTPGSSFPAPSATSKDSNSQLSDTSGSAYATPAIASGRTSASSNKPAASAGAIASSSAPASSKAALHKTKSVDEMSRMLDEMIQDRVERGEMIKSNRGSIMPARGRERRQASFGGVPTVTALDRRRRQSQVGNPRESIGGGSISSAPEGDIITDKRLSHPATSAAASTTFTGHGRRASEIPFNANSIKMTHASGHEANDRVIGLGLQGLSP